MLKSRHQNCIPVFTCHCNLISDGICKCNAANGAITMHACSAKSRAPLHDRPTCERCHTSALHLNFFDYLSSVLIDTHCAVCFTLHVVQLYSFVLAGLCGIGTSDAGDWLFVWVRSSDAGGWYSDGGRASRIVAHTLQGTCATISVQQCSIVKDSSSSCSCTLPYSLHRHPPHAQKIPTRKSHTPQPQSRPMQGILNCRPTL
jgi:hypothetical protein